MSLPAPPHSSRTKSCFPSKTISTVAISYLCKVRKELLNENNGDELATTRKRKQHCQRSADSLRTPEFLRRVHGMMDENRDKSMRDILLKIIRCLKE
ncbi:hypothetical protein ACTXT7_013213 [Hymenolepis weldensis]